MATSFRHPGDRGQATPLVLGLAAVIVVLLLGLGHVARRAADGARARTAADAAALAGTTDGSGGASAMAAANGATLVSFQRIGADVVVTVRVGRAAASARATLNG